MNKIFNKIFNLRFFTVTDIYTISVFLLYIILNFIFYNKLDNGINLLLINISIIILIVLIAIFHSFSNKKIIGIIHYIYPIGVILLIYSQIQEFIPFINPDLYDDLFIKADRFLFGLNPTEWISRFSNKYLTEYLQIAYFSFYLIPIIRGSELLLNKDYEKYNKFAATVLFTFYVSYLMYLIMPAIGPRFTIHNFELLNSELPGLYLTPILREIINLGGGIPQGVSEAFRYVNRDCMPSGHTMITLVVIYLVFRDKSKFRYLIMLLGLSILIATIYLRYHYIVDLIAGAILVIPVLLLEPKIQKFINEKKNYGNIR